MQACARCGLALRAKIAAASRDNRAANCGLATGARLPFAPINAVPALILTRLALGIEIIRDGRAAKLNRGGQNFLHRAMKRGKLRHLKICAHLRRMNARAPKAFVRINIPHSAKNALIEQQRLDARATCANLRDEILRGDIERVRPKIFPKARDPLLRYEPHLAEAPNVRVAKLEAIVQFYERVRVRQNRFVRLARHQLARHAKVNEKVKRRAQIAERLECHRDKFSIAFDARNAAARQLFAERDRILNEIGFAEANAHDAAANKRASQSAHDGFDFGQFRQSSIPL